MRTHVMGRLLTTLAAFALVISACASDSTDEPVDTEVPSSSTTVTSEAAPESTTTSAGETDVEDASLTIAIGQDLGNLDIRQFGTSSRRSVLMTINEPLVRLADNGEVVGVLAESWEQIDDLTIRFNLREAMFHNGNPFNAEAVKYSIEKSLDPDFPSWNKFALSGIVDEVRVVDDYTVEVSSPTPTSQLLPGILTVDIVDPAYDEGGQMETAPVGTGPYTYVSYEPRQEIVLQRFDDYWGGPSYYETITVRVIPDDTTRVSALLAGEVSLVNSVPFSTLEEIRNTDGVTLSSSPTTRLIFLALRNDRPPLDNALVRRAMNYAIDKEELAQTVLEGNGVASDGPMPAAMPNSRSDLGPYPFDPDTAAELLAEAGYDGEEFVLKVGAGRYPSDDLVGQAVANQLQQAGINVVLESTDYSTLSGELSEGEAAPFDAWLQGWASITNDSLGYIKSLYVADVASLPLIKYSSNEVNDLVDTASGTVDEAVISSSLADSQELIWEDAPVVWLYVPVENLGLSENLCGVQARFDEFFFLGETEPCS